jgi:hypothetical protein
MNDRITEAKQEIIAIDRVVARYRSQIPEEAREQIEQHGRNALALLVAEEINAKPPTPPVQAEPDDPYVRIFGVPGNVTAPVPSADIALVKAERNWDISSGAIEAEQGTRPDDSHPGEAAPEPTEQPAEHPAHDFIKNGADSVKTGRISAAEPATSNTPKRKRRVDDTKQTELARDPETDEWPAGPATAVVNDDGAPTPPSDHAPTGAAG